MPRKRPEPRKGREQKRTNFSLYTELSDQRAKKRGSYDAVPAAGKTLKVYPKAFGTRKRVKDPNAAYIGKVVHALSGRSVYWYADRRDRRRKKGTVADRKK